MTGSSKVSARRNFRDTSQKPSIRIFCFVKGRIDRSSVKYRIKGKAMLPAAFAALGFLVGNLTGLSASPIAQALVPALFVLIGGSFITFFSKLSEKDRNEAARTILSFSLSCLIGVYGGIYINAKQPFGTHLNSSYLRGSSVSNINMYYHEAQETPGQCMTYFKTLSDQESHQ